MKLNIFNKDTNSTPKQHPKGFQYVSKDFAESMAHLGQSLINGVACDGAHKKDLPCGADVVALGGSCGNYFAIVGKSTGRSKPGSDVPQEIFTNYDHSNKSLHQVDWDPRIIPIPSEIVGNNTNRLSLEVCNKITDYAKNQLV